MNNQVLNIKGLHKKYKEREYKIFCINTDTKKEDLFLVELSYHTKFTEKSSSYRAIPYDIHHAGFIENS